MSMLIVASACSANSSEIGTSRPGTSVPAADTAACARWNAIATDVLGGPVDAQRGGESVVDGGHLEECNFSAPQGSVRISVTTYPSASEAQAHYRSAGGSATEATLGPNTSGDPNLSIPDPEPPGATAPGGERVQDIGGGRAYLRVEGTTVVAVITPAVVTPELLRALGARIA